MMLERNAMAPRLTAREPYVGYTHLMYALHAIAALMGILSPALVVTMFIFGLPSIVAVIMNYARRDAVRGTWLDTHFRWQLRTFWFALLALVVVLIVSAPLVFVVIGVFTAQIGCALIGAWVIYRIARGWLALREHRAVHWSAPSAMNPATPVTPAGAPQ